MTVSQGTVKPYWIDERAGLPPVWGLTSTERLEKQLKDVDIEADHVLLLRGDVIYDTAVLHGLAGMGTRILYENGEVLGAIVHKDRFEDAQSWLKRNNKPQDFEEVSAAEAGGAYNHALRKRAPSAVYILTKDNRMDVEWQLYKASYKGVTDIVTKFAWPVPAFHAARLCAKLKLSPNMVTSAGAVLVLLALWLFWEGQYGWGLLAGWVMTFLDTVDGKLARCTLTSSKWGNIFDHGIDLIHPPFWYIAWGIGLAAYGTPLPAGTLAPLLWTMFAFYVFGRLIEGYFMRRFGMHIHVWRRFDSWFRTILARRNPNMIVLTISWLAGRPDIGLLLVVGWHVATFAVHCIQLAQAEIARKKGQTVSSWLTAPA